MLYMEMNCESSQALKGETNYTMRVLWGRCKLLKQELTKISVYTF